MTINCQLTNKNSSSERGVILISRNLLAYIVIGLLLGLFHDSIWTGVGAMVLIYIAVRLDELVKLIRTA